MHSLGLDNPSPLGGADVFTAWQPDAVIIIGLLVVAGLYLWGMRRVRRRGRRRWPITRAAFWISGLAVIAVATMSSVGVYDDELFWIHMVQHLLLIMVAPALLVAGRPGILALHASRNPVHTWLKRGLRSRPVTFLTCPLLVVPAYAATIVGTHLTGFMNLVLTNPAVHDLEHLLYLVVGFLYFLPILGDEPIRWRLSYPARLALVFFSMPIDTFTGLALMMTGHEPWPAYAAVHRGWGPSLVTDVHWGGATMWIGGDGVMLVLVLIIFAQWSRRSGRRATSRLGWLEQARLATLDAHAPVHVGAEPASRLGAAQRDPDEDDARLAAYNAWLAQLSGPPSDQHV